MCSGRNGVCAEPGQPQLPPLPGPEGLHEGPRLCQLPQVSPVLAGAPVCQVSPLPFLNQSFFSWILCLTLANPDLFIP